jgi:hypothetical protein
MFCLKNHFVQHPVAPEPAPLKGRYPGGYRYLLNMRTLYTNFRFSLHCKWQSLKCFLLRFCCQFFSKWYYLKHNSICTTGHILKVNNIYTYKEGRYVDIVRLLDVVVDKQYVYCTLYFFNENKIATVSQRLYPDDYTIWQIMENKEFDEIMSRRLWREVNKEDDLLDFAY